MSDNDTIKISSTSDTIIMQQAMADIESQSLTLESYLDKWVCQKAGFEPSPVCVLKPLASAMDEISGAFSTGVSTFLDKWYKVREAAAATVQDLERRDGNTVDRKNVLLGQPLPERLPNGKMIAQ